MQRQYLRGISEYISAALLAIIVLGVGALVVSRIFENAYTAQQLAERQLVKTTLETRQDLIITLAYIDSNDTLHVVIVTDNTPVKLYDVYINDTPWSSRCTLSLNNGQTLIPHNVALPYYAAATITCNGAGSYADVKIVYEGGEAYASAKRI